MSYDRAWTRNEYARNLAEVAAETVAEGDMAAAEQAFDAEPGGFADKLIAAVKAAAASRVEYETEKHVRIPEDPEALTVPALDALVRPFRVRFLRSNPSKTELLEELRAIARRQRRHAEWAPYELVDPLPPRPRPSRGAYYSTAEDHARLREYERLCEDYLRQL
ncbi:hypothetical protein ACIQMJ_27975 [Actinosynnema sp. NPDC091369]